MNTIPVTASRSYNVIVGKGLLKNPEEYITKLHDCQKIAVISDSNVWPLYGDAIFSALERAGFEVCRYVFTAGESSKNGQTYLEILNFLALNQLTRSDMLVALGGGVVGDITGFAAATYLRGIQFIQIPTTLLAMVDSSVGGKTAIDLPAGKNLAGAFCQPTAVLCDLDTLDTLPVEIFRDGCAEVIKYGILYDRELFAHLAETGLNFDRETVISRCIEYKRNVVAEDEFDTGARQMLNLGHTIGHGIEAESNFSITHGQAVAIGMCVVSKAGERLGYTNPGVFYRVKKIMQTFDLPSESTFPVPSLFHAALSDKKRSGHTVNLIVPVDIGNCQIKKTSIDTLESFIKAGL